ncbi:protein of unknown function DUF29 [Stanieria cyanosphaera PCC 7437]|uniref:DUF29 domain-containing protein n=1 Tax=Stanieria cyanosphaera (strain ATCC 29371 / PCC 7437) TaxID=111780 RepID=K9XR71_STAC7|nr:DUF29 domain-containing protein [Stanieria cyanosphaera]AFZ34167.1 protein of unknown function DUF29 [Stanieria cyanosphaera PCC 7437]
MNKIKYEEDYYLWTQTMVEKFKNKDYLNIDWDNLIEEIEDLGKSQKRAVESLLLRLTEHILKLKYWETERERNKKHWQSEVVNFLVLLRKRLKESPSLKNNLAEIYEETLLDSKRSMSKLFDLPEQIELTLAQVLDEDWFPN